MPLWLECVRRSRFGAILALGILTVSCDFTPDRIYSPWATNNPSHPPAIGIVTPVEGTQFHAHDDIHLLVLATPYGTALGPDEEASIRFADTRKWDLRQDPDDPYTVEFFADTNLLGAKVSGAVSASMRSQRGEAVPMIVMMVGYPAVEMVWPDAPAGKYALTVRITNNNGHATVAAPVNITVLP